MKTSPLTVKGCKCKVCVRHLYRATPDVTQGLGFCGLDLRSTPISRILFLWASVTEDLFWLGSPKDFRSIICNVKNVLQIFDLHALSWHNMLYNSRRGPYFHCLPWGHIHATDLPPVGHAVLLDVYNAGAGYNGECIGSYWFSHRTMKKANY